ncbi:MAG: aconitase family protein, partial [Actinomycetota bacterium]|nr:aconitase family protein [Actinomycetota bacterium]
DLSTVVPSIAGPKRPQDRIALSDAKTAFRQALAGYPAAQPTAAQPTAAESTVDQAGAESFPASDAPAVSSGDGAGKPGTASPIPPAAEGGPSALGRRSSPTLVQWDGASFEIDHGAVVIASITSCTNTSNPSVMIGAALLARKAVEAGLAVKPWVKTSMAPGSQVVTDYYQKADLWPSLEKLGFHLVGYGCTTCIGNSGPLPEQVAQAVHDADLVVASVLSGNRNFEGRINPDAAMNYL